MTKTGFIGAGKMAEALISGLLRSGFVKPEHVIASDINNARLDVLKSRYGIDISSGNEGVIRSASTVVLAVKPQDLAGVLSQIGPITGSTHLVISIAAGKTLSFLESYLTASRVIRVMPNMPCLVGAGMSVYCRGSRATSADAAQVEKMLACSGDVIELPEEKFDAVTALSGSGPAFLAYWLKGLTDGAIAAGLGCSEAQRLAVQTMFGTAVALRDKGMSPEELIAAVASPKGTTVAGLAVLEQSGAAGIASRAIDAAAARSKELSRA